MGRELAAQEIGNLATGQSLKNIDVAYIVIAGLPGGKWLKPLVTGLVDINTNTEKPIAIAGYGKSLSSAALDVTVGYGTTTFNHFLKKSDIDKAVIKSIEHYNDASIGITNSIAKQGFK